MLQVSNRDLKSQVREFWNELSCDTQVASAPKFSLDYFEEIEAFRYHDQPFIHSFAQFSRHHMESVGTKDYTRGELRDMILSPPLSDIVVHTEATSADCLSASMFAPLNAVYRACLRLTAGGHDWHPEDYVERPRAGVTSRRNLRSRETERIVFTGNRLGFFHRITARKLPIPG